MWLPKPKGPTTWRRILGDLMHQRRQLKGVLTENSEAEINV